jgi:3-isopropylmalate/(R)-2-methylmalate dehydratase small subunit
MPLAKISKVEGTAVAVPGNDIDTDRIIPARFMKCVTFDGLGEYLFYDVRFDKAGKAKPHPLNESKHAGAKILISGQNFGCGSSREHAPQAIQKFGLQAVIAESFAEIFAGNCTTLGIPCVQLKHAEIEQLMAAVNKDPKLTVTIDLEQSKVRWGSSSAPFEMKGGGRESLLKGEWDALGQLIDGKDQVAALAGKLDYFKAN